MAITFPINPQHGQQYAPAGIPITWQFDSGRNAWRVMRVGPAWSEIAGKPVTFPPSAHNHPIGEVNGLQSVLDGKQDLSSKAYPNGYASLDQDGRVPIGQLPFGTFTGEWNDITGKPAEFPPSPHTHPVAQISDSSSTGQQIVRAPTGADVLNIIGGINQDGNARVQVEKNNAIIGVRRSINFKEGTNVTMSIVDDPGNEEVGVTINAAGGGGGASITVSEIKPAAPIDSSMWLDVATGILFIYYNDGSTSQWIEALPYLTAMPGTFTKFDFPASPINDQLYNPFVGATWKWSSTRGVWYAVSSTSGSYTQAQADAKFVDIVGDVMTGPLGLVHPPTANVHAASKQYVDERLIVSSTPPVGAADGTLWWEDDSGQLYLRYNDGNTSQWVVAVPQPDTSTFLTKSSQSLTTVEQTQVRSNVYAAPFDALAYNGMQVNGGMEVSQERGTTGINITDNTATYVLDGWVVQTSGTHRISAGQAVAPYIPNSNYINSFVANVATINAAPAAGHYCVMWQKIEGYRVAHLGWGTANAQPITISFWIYTARSGTYSGTVINGAFNRSYPFSFSTTGGAWEYKTVTIPGDTSGTWAKDNTASIGFYFTLLAGTNFTAPAGAWVAGGYMGANGTANGVSTTGDNMLLTGVTVHPGTQAPTAAQSANIMRPYDQELVTCRRYYEKLSYSIASSIAPGDNYIQWKYSAAKRAVPTFTAGAGTLITALSSQAIDAITAYRTAGAIAYFETGCTADARL